ncbi:hypothetical protein ACWHLZ_29130 [Streptomyces chartreusis]
MTPQAPPTSSLKPVQPPTQAFNWQDVEWDITVFTLGRSAAIGALMAFTVGLAVAWSQTAVGPFWVACGYLAARHQMPVRLMAFLTDAHEHRRVLRQSGALYQFRHIELQKHLAAPAPRR